MSETLINHRFEGRYAELSNVVRSASKDPKFAAGENIYVNVLKIIEGLDAKTDTPEEGQSELKYRHLLKALARHMVFDASGVKKPFNKKITALIIKHTRDIFHNEKGYNTKLMRSYLKRRINHWRPLRRGLFFQKTSKYRMLAIQDAIGFKISRDFLIDIYGDEEIADVVIKMINIYQSLIKKAESPEKAQRLRNSVVSIMIGPHEALAFLKRKSKSREFLRKSKSPTSSEMKQVREILGQINLLELPNIVLSSRDCEILARSFLIAMPPFFFDKAISERLSEESEREHKLPMLHELYIEDQSEDPEEKIFRERADELLEALYEASMDSHIPTNNFYLEHFKAYLKSDLKWGRAFEYAFCLQVTLGSLDAQRSSMGKYKILGSSGVMIMFHKKKIQAIMRKHQLEIIKNDDWFENPEIQSLYKAYQSSRPMKSHFIQRQRRNVEVLKNVVHYRSQYLNLVEIYGNEKIAHIVTCLLSINIEELRRAKTPEMEKLIREEIVDIITSHKAVIMDVKEHGLSGMSNLPETRILEDNLNVINPSEVENSKELTISDIERFSKMFMESALFVKDKKIQEDLETRVKDLQKELGSDLSPR